MTALPRSLPHRPHCSSFGLVAAAAAGLALAGLAPQEAHAGPVVCTTSLEAAGGTQLVEMSRCQTIQTTSELVDRRFYSYTAPYARGIDITHQITDFFGIAMGGGDGTRVMGLGFPDQTIVWDGTAVENTYQVLLEEQSSPESLRTADVFNGFGSSLAAGAQAAGGSSRPVGYGSSVRGLW